MKKKNIFLITSSRADFSILKKLGIKLASKKNLNLNVLATGSHVSKEYGYTINDVKKNFKRIIKLKVSTNNKNKKDILSNSSNLINKFTKKIDRKKIDLAIILGDRYEIFIIAYIFKILKIKILHISGGDTTVGSYDDNFRSCISQLSNYHIVTNFIAYKKLVKSGINKDYIFNFGLLSIENPTKMSIYSKEFLSKLFNFEFKKKNYLITIHSETANLKDRAINYLNNIEKIISIKKDISFIFTSSNFDYGGNIINNKIKKIVKKYPNTYYIKSFGSDYYFEVLKYMSCVIGNSSSGILEAPSFGIPTINLGNRQDGRISSQSVINVDGSLKSLKDALKKIETNIFIKKMKKSKNPYFKKNSLKKHVNLVEKILSSKLV